MHKERDTYKYLQIGLDGKSVFRGLTYDLERREAEHQLDYPGSRIEQIGRKVTREEGMKWERLRKV